MPKPKPNPNTKAIPKAILTTIEERWISRVKAQRMKPKGAAYDKAEIEFFCGAMCGLMAANPAYQAPVAWCANVFSGRRIVALERFA